MQNRKMWKTKMNFTKKWHTASHMIEKLWWPPIFFSVVLFILSGCSLRILPDNKNFRVIAYSDATGDHGNSLIWQEAGNSGIKFKYLLREGFPYPFAGISLNPDSGLLDLHTYKYIDILLSADTTCAVNIYLKTCENNITVPGDYITYRFLEKTIWITDVPQWYRIELSSFITPQWWIELHKKDHLNEPDLKKVHNFDIATNVKQLEREGYIHVHKFILKKDISGIYYVLSVVVFASVSVVLSIIIHFKKKKSATVQIISYKQQETTSKLPTDEERILLCIGRRYAQTGYCLNDISKESGVHITRISSIIKKRYGLTFKQYINKIKIEEAKRLLRETDRQILDIALTVGYGDASHFNRTFKLNEGCSPREFRTGITVSSKNQT